MSCTSFGNTRDLFKFDLVRHVMKALPGFESFTFVPMLSQDDVPAKRRKSPSNDMEIAIRAGKAGSQNKELLASIKRLQEIDCDLEYFQTIKSYFEKENILIDILQKHPFSHEGRSQYFNSILARFPKKSLIFLDPDIGLEEDRPSKKHLLFDEVWAIYDRMDQKSVLMIYQHFPVKKKTGYVRHRCQDLKKVTGTCPVSITDNEIVFFFLVKNPGLKANLDDELNRYANTYPVLESCSCR